MRSFLKIALAGVALVAMSTSVFAACKEYVTVTPDNAPVYGPVTRTVVVGQTPGGPDHNGDAYTKATFCPAKAAPDTCTGESLSTFVAGPIYGDVTATELLGLYGPVDDVTEHRNGFNSPVAIPKLGVVKGFNPWPGNAGALQPGACS
jgi:hypothetical protein